MKQALQARRFPPAQTAGVTSRPPPIGGWNTRDSLAMMKPTDAVVLDNWVARPSKVELRKGSENHATGLPGEVETLMAYRPATGSGKLFAVSGTGIYDVSSAGAVGASVSTVTQARWQHTNFATSAGQFLCAVNGVDDYRYYNGSTWTTVATFTFGAGTVDTDTLIGICAHQSRLYFIQKNSLRFYYLDTAGTIFGTVEEFNLDQVFPGGGYLMAMGSWTFDGGDGPEDRAVFISSEGEVAVYVGTDPGDSAAWRLVGTFQLPRPVGRRCLLDFAGDLIILTDGGLFPLSKALSSAQVNQSIALTDKIAPTIARDAATQFSTFGWEMALHSQESLLLLCAPTSPRVVYCMDTLSRGWSRFLGWEARCIEVFDGKLYYGGDEVVVKAFFGSSDPSGAIEGVIMPAFDYFGARGQIKHLEMFRPHWEAQGGFSYAYGAKVDFDREAMFEPLASYGNSASGVWDTAKWDEAYWSSDSTRYAYWHTVAVRDGYCLAPYLRVSTNAAQPSLLGLDYILHSGGAM